MVGMGGEVFRAGSMSEGERVAVSKAAAKTGWLERCSTRLNEELES